MDAEQLLREGRLDDALAQLKEQVRDEPAKSELRMFLFQLLSLVGDWDRALTQLNVAAEMDGEKFLIAEICRPALNSEALRTAIFRGERSPLVFGEPDEWVSWVIQANQMLAQGQHAAALELRDRAFEAAPAISGRLNGEPFEWIADMDTRLGPILEAVVEHKYFWIPFPRIKAIRVEEPKALRNMVWAEAQFTWANGGQAPGLIPSRYVGSESSDDDILRLGRRTSWSEPGEGHSIGTGQRMLATDSGEWPLLEVRSIVLDVPEEGGGQTTPMVDSEINITSAPPQEPPDG
jgi:type VI secretion system protein ImpE